MIIKYSQPCKFLFDAAISGELKIINDNMTYENIQRIISIWKSLPS